MYDCSGIKRWKDWQAVEEWLFCKWVGEWNDDEVTQGPHSRPWGFSLLAINCQSTGENCKLYSKPIRAKPVHDGVYVCMHGCVSLCSWLCFSKDWEREYKELHDTKQALARVVFRKLNDFIQESTQLLRDGCYGPKNYIALDLTYGRLRWPVLIGKYNQMTRDVPFACQIFTVVDTLHDTHCGY